jgi:small ligand-binding sensory domain FIST
VQFATATTKEPDARKAVDELLLEIDDQLCGQPADLAVLFLSSYYVCTARPIARRIHSVLRPQAMIGCSAAGVIGDQRELEGRSSMSLIAAHLPEVELSPYALQPAGWKTLFEDRAGFRRAVDAPRHSQLSILLCDPFSMHVNQVIYAFNRYYPGLPLVGGVASGAHQAGGNVLLIDDRTMDSGAVGVTMAGDFEVEVLVSQSCRPIGQPFNVTDASDNMILSLDGQPPLAWIEDLIPDLSHGDRDLLHRGLFLGRAIYPAREELGCGDFLVREVIGLDRRSGAIAVGESVRKGDRVQFHLQDARAAQSDLEMVLIPHIFRESPSGALLFSCMGRGSRFYHHPDGDVSVIQENLGGVHLAGAFCDGEIAPIGRRNFLHGHAASLALFWPAQGAA